MAIEQGLKTLSRVAGGTVTQFSFVAESTASEVVNCSAVTDLPIGVAQESGTSGDVISIAYEGITKVLANGALEIGNVVGTAANGEAVAKTPNTSANDGEYICGMVTGSPATATSGEITSVLLFSPWMSSNTAAT